VKCPKWTGNGSKKIKPDKNEYETVKVNYGVRPDGSKDFPELPAGDKNRPHHISKGKDVPDHEKIQGYCIVLDC
jgi:hypothetical protein